MIIKNYQFKFALLVTVVLLFKQSASVAQGGTTSWATDGYQYYVARDGGIAELDTRDASKQTLVVSSAMLTPQGGSPIRVRRFAFSGDGKKILINTNTRKVWRYDTRGDYWVYDLAAKTLKQVGKNRPESSLMFAKLSPDGLKAAYVSEHNIYVEDLASGAVKQLTGDGTKKLINGTFDWAYEEEFDCRDGFRWSPDGKSIAYWQLDASKTKNYLMLNTTDSVYPYVVPVEYPVAGQDPSLCRIGVVNADGGNTTWLKVPGDAIQHYIPRMEWANANEIILQQLNRAQTESKVLLCNAKSGEARAVYGEKDNAWIDTKSNWNGGSPMGWEWIEKGKAFVWASEKDGWRHLYRVSLDGKETLITKGNYDVIKINLIDEAAGYIYFIASPDNPTQRYLYRVKISGGTAQRISPANEPGTHGYEISPNGKIAIHNFSNSFTAPAQEMVSLPAHNHLSGEAIVVDAANKPKGSPEFFRVKTADGVELDGWMVKPTNFDPHKKYPVLFYVYGEPASQVVTDTYGVGINRLYISNMADDGYIYMAVDNRGAPAPRGREWRKSIYRNIGTLNIRDQAMAAKEISKWAYVDTSRIAVWGWSGGGSSTLNLMFQYPEIYKTGIAVAAVGWQLSYDNIYQERYMGVPTDEEGRSYFLKGSPVTYAKNLRGNLLYIHGTGDDNVHYQNAELLINELVKYNKQFQLMSYPNRTHSISEGEGTGLHLSTLFTQYLKEHCAPGGR
ncbi:S9 family peptidase [Mucilaginibacter paludis]|uniref:Peptidase S9B dipeptidylpeptidase IV domain protein n=1 Tax=Mucilaginibacter paludis DSM 18603 TaxID=714943 RepID=H1XZM7_9SPHI|nr:S9 family peptidase [Mucilaginibacter paludis]EHQ26671.1 peptidase S9B dipeptidylpeptidase IV domain protein [Mucilaginibacter paludis DSM 18603]